jgi:superfamily I DNA and RNA helicase
MTHHICIHDEYCTFDGELIPFGKESIEKEITKVINDILEMIVHKIGDDDIVVCGIGDARRMLGRKLEDRLKREVKYE